MKLLRFLVATTLLQLAAIGASGDLRGQSPGQADRSRWNILLITADDLGLQLSSYGNAVIQTPHLDGLAASGVRFRIAYVTQASCSPSRSSIFTGLYPHATGQYGLGAGSGLHPYLYDATIPALLKNAGYRTGLVGKLHVSPEEVFPFDFRPLGVRGRRVREVARLAEQFLKENGDRPFFLMVSYSDPHASWEVEDQGWFRRQVDGLPEHPIDPGAKTVLPFQQIDTPSQRLRVANYYNSVLRLDAGVGMLLEALDRLGYAESTLVIFVGDHGPPFARAKTTTYEAGLRIPFLVRWPGVAKPAVSDALVSTTDILPTVLDAARLDIPRGLHGSSLRPLLSGSDTVWRSYLAAEFHLHVPGWFYPRRAIRNHRFKLIHNLLSGNAKPMKRVDKDVSYRAARRRPYRGTAIGQAYATYIDPPEFELYDLESDPIEFHNLAGLPEYRGIQAALTEALSTWRRETDDPFLDSAFTADAGRRLGQRGRTRWEFLLLLVAVLPVLLWWRSRARRASRGRG